MKDKQMFESWKEISAYLKRSYKTLRRLERELELPVHRLEDSPHARVFAYKEEIDRWMQEMQKTGKISRRKIGTKKFLTGALITLAVLYAAVIVGLFLWLFQPDETTVPLSLEKPSVAILGFENLSSDESLEYLRHGLQDLLTSDLSQSVYLRVLRRDEIDDVLNSLALFDAKRYSLRDKVDIAQRCRVDYLLCGSFIMAGNELEITAYLIDSETGETLFPLTAIAKGEGDIFRMVDGLTLDIKEKLSITQEQIVRDIDREARLITTSSPEAFRCFIIGKHNNSIGKYSKAIEVFERALDIDPEFAMVYREMAFSYEYMGQTETYFSLLEKAFSLAARLTDREELLIKGEFYRWKQSKFDLAINIYDQLLELYPEEPTGNYFQGENYIWIEEWDKAIERLEIARKYWPEEVEIYDLLALAYRAKGEYNAAREILETYLEKFMDNSSIRRYLAQTYLYDGKYDVAHLEIDKAISLDPEDFRNIVIKGDIYHFSGDLARAEREYHKLLEMENPQSPIWGSNRLSCLYLLKGQFIKAKKRVERGIGVAEKIGEMRGLKYGLQSHLIILCEKLGEFESALEKIEELETCAQEEDNFYFKEFSLFVKGRLYAEMGFLDEAQCAAEEYKSIIEKGLKQRRIREYYALMGLIELKRGHFIESIAYSKKALSVIFPPASVYGGDPAGIVYPLAQAYYRSGKIDEAEKEFKRITRLVMRGFSEGDVFAKSHYMLGKIYEQKGWKGKAIEHYEKFLDLWKDADPGIVEIEDARERLARLTTNQ